MDKHKLTEIEELKYWLDAELTTLHIGFALVIGILVGGRSWWLVGAYIAFSFVYAIRRALVLPQGYIRLPKDKK